MNMDTLDEFENSLEKESQELKKPSVMSLALRGNKNNEIWTEELALDFGNDILQWMREKPENIFFKQFIYVDGDLTKYHNAGAKVYADTPKYLASRFDSFKEILNVCREIEEAKLLNMGSFNKINSGMAKFVLSCNFNYAEKSQQTVKVENQQILNNDPLKTDEE